MKLTDLVTPVALIDLPRMQHNIERMQAQVTGLGATFRPHVKTSKCVQTTEAQIRSGAQVITVYTVK
jgi:D-serine deaminase-like pyridoxal phosphate-dependent protein